MARRRLAAAGAIALLLGIAVAVYVINELKPIEKRGSAREEFVATEQEPVRSRKQKRRVPWPTYGFDRQRRHVAFGLKHRPPYRRVWQADAQDALEYPPSVGYGRVYLAQQRGLFFALNARTGKVEWKKKNGRCSATAPTVAGGMVYQAWMDFDPCPPNRPGASGYLVAWDAKTGRRRWRFGKVPVESSPLVVGRHLYVGIERKLYALRAKTGRKRWSFQGEDELNTAPAYWRGKVYIAGDQGNLYAVSARTGRLRWRAQSNATFGRREYFYATPTVANGRVYIGNTDGTMYAYGARTGRLLWAKPLGTYIYSAAAVWRRTVYVGTYDGWFYALDAATGDVKWKRPAPGAVHAAPTVMSGYVYFSTCNGCGSAASRAVKQGPNRTYALNARTGKVVWRFRGGKYANPIVADRSRVYLTGYKTLFALVERKRRR